MLEFCRAIIVAPNPFEGRKLAEIAEQCGFGDVVGIFEQADGNGLRYPVTFFLLHHGVSDADAEDIIDALRGIERDGLCFSPVVTLIVDDPSAVPAKYVRMGVDDVISLPQSPPDLARRLEMQLETDIVYFETADYLGPDRRRLDPEGAQRRPSEVSPHTQLVIRRDPQGGTRVVSRQRRDRQHFQTIPESPQPIAPLGAITAQGPGLRQEAAAALKRA